jgi:hypothetical protein
MDFNEHEQLFLTIVDQTGVATERLLEQKFSEYYADKNEARVNLVYARNSLTQAHIIEEREDPLEGIEFSRV